VTGTKTGTETDIETDIESPGSFLRAAHYFGDGWPLDSMQVLRQPALRRELRGLRKLGFNAIILVVPWQGFQVSQDPPTYDAFYEAQLRLALREAQAQGLAVVLRASYVHQVMLAPAIGSVHMAQRLLTQPVYEAAWLDYLRRVHGIADEYPGFHGLFVSWEELWHAFRYWQLQDARTRQTLAQEVGFLEFLCARGVSGVDAIPEREDPAHRHFHAFINDRIRRVFEQAREVVPGLGVEYRVDKDPVHEAGDVQWLDNDAFLDWEPQRYSYWAPFMGAENVGESLSAEQALGSLAYMLSSTSVEGVGNRQVIDQFNYIDDTAQYAGQHAVIAASQLRPFLRGAADLLARGSGGYGLWAPRDYRCNILYNPAFLDRARGWDLERATAQAHGGVRLEPSGRATQRIKPGIPWVPRMHPFDEANLEVQVTGEGLFARSRLRVRFNEHTWVALERVGRGRYVAKVPLEFDTIRTRGIGFELENAGGPVLLERLWLFHLVYRVGVQTVHGAPGEHAAEVRRFNRRLRSLRPDPA